MATYKGYTYYQTDATTPVRYQRAGSWRERTGYLYEIEGLKPAGKRPFLTSVQAVRDYIDSTVDGLQLPRAEVGQRIRSARASRGMTQLQVGENIGFSGNRAKVAVARWESGTRPVPPEHIRPLCELLGLDPLDLLP